MSASTVIRYGITLAGVVWAFALSCASLAGPVIFSAAGSTAADIQGTVDAFRNTLGALNPNVATSFTSGRREINWDGVPDAFAAPNSLPGDFFNVTAPAGVVLSTPGAGFQVSAAPGNPTNTPVRFGNLDPSYPQSLYDILGFAALHEPGQPGHVRGLLCAGDDDAFLCERFRRSVLERAAEGLHANSLLRYRQ